MLTLVLNWRMALIKTCPYIRDKSPKFKNPAVRPLFPNRFKMAQHNSSARINRPNLVPFFITDLDSQSISELNFEAKLKGHLSNNLASC